MSSPCILPLERVSLRRCRQGRRWKTWGTGRVESCQKWPCQVLTHSENSCLELILPIYTYTSFYFPVPCKTSLSFLVTAIIIRKIVPSYSAAIFPGSECDWFVLLQSQIHFSLIFLLLLCSVLWVFYCLGELFHLSNLIQVSNLMKKGTWLGNIN